MISFITKTATLSFCLGNLIWLPVSGIATLNEVETSKVVTTHLAVSGNVAIALTVIVTVIKIQTKKEIEREIEDAKKRNQSDLERSLSAFKN